MFVRALVFAVLSWTTACSADHELHCPSKYESAACRSYRQNGEALQTLHDVCSEVPFASGCSVHRHCGETAPESDICFPVNHLLSICLEFPDVDACAEFEEKCGQLERLSVCEGVTQLELLSTMNAFEAAREICGEQDMEQCRQCLATQADPVNTDERNRFANDCLDPLGTLSTLCEEVDMIPCDAWKEWCALETTQGLPAMCEMNEMSHEHHNHDRMTLNAITACERYRLLLDGGMHGPAAETMSNADDDACVMDPTGEECEDYMYPLDLIQKDILDLCVTEGSGMPWMPGCSIREACREMNRNDGFCDPFTLLTTLCKDMPRMSGCRRYNSMCSTDSRVHQCHSNAAIPASPKTMSTQEAIISACGSHTMEACVECPAVGARCPNTLQTMTTLCFTMPSMPFCREHQRFCSATDNYFGRFCDRSTGDYLPPMRMYFHFGQRDIILFKDWIPESTTGYVASFFAIVLFGVILQGIKALRTVLESSWYRMLTTEQDAGDCSTCVQPGPSCDPSCEKACETKCGAETPIQSANKLRFSLVKRNLIRAILTGATACLDLLLMLIAMTFNVGLFIAVVLGMALGVFFFGHVVERDYLQTTVPLSKRAAARSNMDAMQGCCS